MREFVTNVTLIVVSTTLTLLICEVGYRIWSGVPILGAVKRSPQSEATQTIGCGNRFDPELGWKPEPLRTGVNDSGGKVSILESGIRSNGQPNPTADSVVLAIGDSFTFGDQVGDHQSWPAALERHLGLPVLNGGVCGYGIGQSVRRAEILVDKFRPGILILGMIPTDIDRTRASRFYGRPKPYFVLENGRLVYEHNHLADSLIGTAARSNEDQTQPSLTRTFADALNRHSLLWASVPNVPHMIEKVQQRVALMRGTAHTYISPNGVELSCRLFSRVKSLEQAFDLKAYLLVQYKFRDILNRIDLENNRAQPTDGVDIEIVANTIALISCADEIGLHVVDTFPPLRDIYLAGGRAQLSVLYQDHMSPKGNQLIGQILANHVNSLSELASQ